MNMKFDEKCMNFMSMNFTFHEFAVNMNNNFMKQLWNEFKSYEYAMNMNSKPMNEFIYEPNLHEYEYEYWCQFMKHDEYSSFSNSWITWAIWTKAMFFLMKNRFTTVKEIKKVMENLKMPGEKNAMEKSNMPGKVKFSKIWIVKN